MAQTETRVITAHVPIPLAEKVDHIAARLERSRGWILGKNGSIVHSYTAFMLAKRVGKACS